MVRRLEPRVAHIVGKGLATTELYPRAPKACRSLIYYVFVF